MSDAMQGTWILQSSENFEELLASFNVGLTTRKLALFTVPTLTISRNEDLWKIRADYWSKSSTLSFEIGEEFEERLPNDRLVKFVCTIERDYLIQLQQDSKYPMSITRWVENEVLVMRVQHREVICIRKYIRLRNEQTRQK